MKQIALILGLLLALTASSFAATCAVSSVQVKGNDGTLVQMAVKDDGTGSGNCAAVVTDPAVLAAVQSAIPAGTNLIGKVGVDQTTPGNTNGLALVGVNAATALAGAGAVGAGSARMAVGQDATTIAGAPPGRTYNTVAASQSTQALTGGGGGATGDYLSHCVVFPTSTSPGVVTILDNATTISPFAGGASSLSNLVPFTIPVGAVSTSGAWKVTTGAGLSVACYGKFT